MALTSGTKLGPYEVLSPLGAGGMGEVYRAKDTRLGREVALKILPELFASEPERLRRFEQEARAVAALNHPNILAIHDIGAQGEGANAVPFLVSELLEGETLRAVLDRGAGDFLYLPQRNAHGRDGRRRRWFLGRHAGGVVPDSWVRSDLQHRRIHLRRCQGW